MLYFCQMDLLVSSPLTVSWELTHLHLQKPTGKYLI